MQGLLAMAAAPGLEGKSVDLGSEMVALPRNVVRRIESLIKLSARQ